MAAYGSAWLTGPDRWANSFMAYVSTDPSQAHGIAPEAESLGVFKANRDAPFHRWVHLTEGFSAKLVAQELRRRPDVVCTYDPFGGTGTTPLVAAEMGQTAAWAEVNPYLQEAARIKIAAACAHNDEREQAISTLLELLREDEPPSPAHAPESPIVAANISRNFFEPDALADLLGWLHRFESLSGLARRIGLLAVTTSAIQSSNMIRATDLRRRTARELERKRSSACEAVRERVRMMVDDLRETPVASGSAVLVSADARTLPDDFGDVDLVVTSPPYLNGTNYCRNTKLELLLLGLIRDEAGLADIRSRSVTAGINNVSKRIPEPNVITPVEAIATQLDTCTYDVRIPKMVRAYFSDMRIVLRETRRVMRPGGQLVLDIGDSRFAGVHVDAPELLSVIAQEVGWELEGVETIRHRVARDGSPLCQKLLRLCSP
jgi:DNA modification methylase